MKSAVCSALICASLLAVAEAPISVSVAKLRDKWRVESVDASTGKLAPELRAYLATNAPVWERSMSWSEVKAKAFAYLCDNTAAEVVDWDYFPVFARWHRHTAELHPYLPLMYARGKRISAKRFPGLRWSGDGWWMYLDYDHSAPDWDDVLKLGFTGMRERLLKNWKDDEYHRTRLAAADAILRLADRLAGTGTNSRTKSSLRRLREGPPKTTLDVLEMIYLYFVISENFEGIQVRTLGNLDRLLTPYYRADLAAGRITEEEFKDMLRCFWWQWGSIDNYWGQPVYFGGTKADGSTEYNEVTRMLMEVHDELALPTPKVHLKIGRSTPDWFWRQSLEMMRRQSSLTFIGEEPHWRVIRHYGYTEEQARNFLVWGCYEWAIRDSANDTCGGTIDVVRPISRMLEAAAAGKFAADDFDAFRREYLKRTVATFVEARDGMFRLQQCLDEANPSMLFSLATDYSVKSGKDAFSGGMRYGNNTGMWMVGLGTAVDSLMAVKELVYENEECRMKNEECGKGGLSLKELGELMARNWEGQEPLRLRMKRSKRKWGNNDPEANLLAKELVKAVGAEVNGVRNSRGGFFKLSGHSARCHYDYGHGERATPDGRRAGDELSKNIAATMGADTEGATALIASYANLDPVDLPGDFPCDMALLPGSIKGEKGLALMRMLIERYFANGGLVIHFNVVGAETLKEAQRHPEKYQNLQVRVCGWNVRWNDIPKKEQDAFILRQENLELK